MNRLKQADAKRWARLVKTNDAVREIRKIICFRCTMFKKSSEDRYANGCCQYYNKTGDFRAWSIFECINMGSFRPKMNVNTEEVRKNLDEWIRKRDAAAVGNMSECRGGGADGGVRDSSLSDDAYVHEDRKIVDIKEGVQEV